MLGDPTDLDSPLRTNSPGAGLARPDLLPRLSWGPGASLGGTILVVLVFWATQILTVVGFLILRQLVRPGAESAGRGWGGIVILVGSILAALMVLALVALLIAIRGWAVGAYLAWRVPSGRAVRRALGGLVLILAAGLGMALALNRPIVTPTPAEAARGVPLGLVILTVAVALPLAEEVLFRGFLYRGLAESTLGPGTAIGLTALAWAVFQAALQVAPVNLYSVACLYLFGLFLGIVRHHSGSLPLVVVIHGIASTVALAEAVYFSG